jgi:hypothetical protein
MGRAIKRGGEAVRATIISIILCLSAPFLSGCRETYEWNQKLTVTVVTPSGEVSGAAVVHEKVWWGQLPASSSEVEYKIEGEATMVEVAPGKYLFALLGGSEEQAMRTFPGNPGDSSGADWKVIESLRESRPLPRDAWPMLVTFGNVSDPKSVKEVDPKNLAAVFGPGYRLKEMRLEITDEAVTKGAVEKVLGWLGPYPEPGLCPPQPDNKVPFCRTVHHGDFTRR